MYTVRYNRNQIHSRFLLITRLAVQEKKQGLTRKTKIDKNKKAHEKINDNFFTD